MTTWAFSSPIAAMFASTIRMSLARTMSLRRMSTGWLKNLRSAGHARIVSILFLGGSKPLVGVAAVVFQLLGQHAGEELGGVVEVGVSLAGVDRLLAQILTAGQQQREYVLEHRQAAVLVRRAPAPRSPRGRGSAGELWKTCPSAVSLIAWTMLSATAEACSGSVLAGSRRSGRHAEHRAAPDRDTKRACRSPVACHLKAQPRELALGVHRRSGRRSGP